MTGARRSASKTDASTRPSEVMPSKPVLRNLISKNERSKLIAMNSLAGKQCLSASRRQQFTRRAVDFFDQNLWDGDAVNHALGLTQRNVTFRCAAIEQQHYPRANCRGDVHGTSVVRNKNRQPRQRRRQLSNRELIQNHCARRQELTHFRNQCALFGARKNDWSRAVVADQRVGELRKSLQRPTPAFVTGARKQTD